MRVGGWLGDQDSRVTLDEVMRAHIGHDFRAWQDFGMEFIFELMELLLTVSFVLMLSELQTCPLIVIHLHVDGRLM